MAQRVKRKDPFRYVLQPGWVVGKKKGRKK